jgi:hypothetical protein
VQLLPLLRAINDRLFSGNAASDVGVLSRFFRHLAGESANAISWRERLRGKTVPRINDDRASSPVKRLSVGMRHLGGGPRRANPQRHNMRFEL